MEFMVAYFPMLKAALAVLSIGIIVYLGYKQQYKTAGILTILFIVIGYFAPVKYDGTDTKKNHIQTHQQRTAEYRDVVSTAIVKEAPKPTFAERMAAETARSKAANTATAEDLK